MPYHPPSGRESLGRWLRLCVALNVLVLFLAQVAKGARAELSGTMPSIAGGGQTTLGPRVLSNDNVPSAVRRLSDAHAWLIAGIVLLLSGVWPHIKLIATYFIVHFVHEGRVQKSRGHHMLCVLEALGKYSFADIFLIAIYVACFTIVTPRYSILGGLSHLQVSVCIFLELGVALLVLAIVASTAITFWAAHSMSPPQATQQEALCEGGHEAQPLRTLRSSLGRSVSLMSASSGEVPELTGGADAGRGSRDSNTAEALLPAWRSLAAMVVAAMALGVLLIGGSLPILHVERRGFLGKLLGNPGQDLDVSLFNFAEVFWQAGRTAGVHMLHLAFFTSVLGLVSVLAPTLELASLGACAVATYRSRLAAARWWYDRACWLHSFDAVDVLLIVVVVCVQEMEQIVNFHVGGQCDDFKQLINNKPILELAGLGFAADPNCFTIAASLGVGCYIALVVIVLRTVVWRLLRQPTEEGKAANT